MSALSTDKYLRQLTSVSVFLVMLTSGLSGQEVVQIPPGPIPILPSGDRIIYVDDGSLLPRDFLVGEGVRMDVTGDGSLIAVVGNGGILNLRGTGTDRVRVQSGGVLNVESSGQLSMLRVEQGGAATIAGGQIGLALVTAENANLTFVGFGFEMNGQLLGPNGSTGDVFDINFADDWVLTGYLADGTPLVLTSRYTEYLATGNVRVELSNEVPFTEQVYVAPATAVPQAIMPGQTLVLEEGGATPFRFHAMSGSTVINNGGRLATSTYIHRHSQLVSNGGSADTGLETFQDATVQLNDTTVGLYYRGYGSTVTIRDSEFDMNPEFSDGARVTMESGTMGDFARFFDSTYDMQGGSLANFARFAGGSTVRINGGTIGIMSSVDTGAVLTLDGGELASRFTVGEYFFEPSTATFHVIDGRIGDTLAIAGEATATFDGGEIGRGVQFRDNARGVINAGEFAGAIRVEGDSIVEINGGNLGDLFTLSGNSAVALRGGTIGDVITNRENAVLTLYGSDFRVDDVTIPGLVAPGDSATFEFEWQHLFTAVLADGTPFFHGSLNDNGTSNTVVRLVKVEVPPPAELDILVQSRTEMVGIRDGQVLTVVSGGQLPDHFNAGSGSELHIEGGTVGRNFEAYRAAVTLEQGSIGDDSELYAGSRMVVRGGDIDARLIVYDGAQLIIEGGVLGDHVSSYDQEGVEIKGGQFGAIKFVRGLTLHGGDFTIDGETEFDVDNDGWLLNDLHQGTTVTGVLADGTPFILSPSDSGAISHLRFVRENPPAASPDDIVVRESSVNVPAGLRSGQTLTLLEGGHLSSHFAAGPGSAVTLAGGTIGDDFETAGARVDITGDVLLARLEAYLQSEVHMSQGGIDYCVVAQNSSLVMNGGSIKTLDVSRDSQFVLQGGEVDSILALSRASVEIRQGFVRRGTVGIGSSLSLHDGAVVDRLQVSSEGNLQMLGGLVVDELVVMAKGEAELYGGIIGGSFMIESQADVSIRGGTLAGPLLMSGFSKLALTGVDFELDGEPIAGLEVVGSQLELVVPASSVLTMRLADGTPTLLASWRGDALGTQPITLVRADEPLVTTTPIELPGSAMPRFLSPKQVMTVREGAEIPGHFRSGQASRVTLDGGVIGPGFKSFGSHIQLVTGAIGDHFDAFPATHVENLGGDIGHDATLFADSTLTMSGGSIGDRFRALGGSTVRLQGGSVGDNFEAQAGAIVEVSGATVEKDAVFRNAIVRIDGGTVGDQSTMDHAAVDMFVGTLGPNARLRLATEFSLHGGVIGDQLRIHDESVLTVRGGTIGDQIQAVGGSEVRVYGNDFRIDGRPLRTVVAYPADETIDQLTLDTSSFRTISGTLADGTPFVFSQGDGDSFLEAKFLVSEVPVAAGTIPRALSLADLTRRGLRSGERLTVHAEDSVPDHFNAGRGSTINMKGGTIGKNLELAGASLTLWDGVIGDYLDAYDASRVVVHGGTIGEGFDVERGSWVRMENGVIGDKLTIRPGGMFEMRGGYATGSVLNESQYPVIIRGGEIGGSFFVGPSASLFLHDGEVRALGVMSNSRTVIFDGSIQNTNGTGAGSNLSIFGGQLSFNAPAAGIINLVNGNVGGRISVAQGGVANIRGGRVEGFDIRSNATLNISGGQLGYNIDVAAGGLLNIFGSEFLLDGNPLDELQSNGDSLLLDTRGEHVLSAVLRDGNRVQIPLRSTNSYTGFLDPLSELRLFVVPSWQADDLNRDDQLDIEDLDLLIAAIAGQGDPKIFDLNSDDRVDLSDRDYWLKSAASKTQDADVTYLVGDANLDGVVDFSDLNAWNTGKYSLSGLWSRGDFNADGVTDIADFNLWNSNKFRSLPSAIVPEGTFSSWTLLLSLLVAGRHLFHAQQLRL